MVPDISPFFWEINFKNSPTIISKKNILFFIIKTEKKFFAVLLKFMSVKIFSNISFCFSTEYVGFFMKFLNSSLELKTFEKVNIFDKTSSISLFSFDNS